jgi:hypothetical protein
MLTQLIKLSAVYNLLRAFNITAYQTLYIPIAFIKYAWVSEQMNRAET